MLKRNVLAVSLTCLFLLPATSQADYVWRDAQGVRQYSDVCPTGVKCRELSPQKSRSTDTPSTDTTSTSSGTTSTTSTDTSAAPGTTTSTAPADTTSTSSSTPSTTSTSTTSTSSGTPAIAGVSGTFYHGQAIAISGSSFGSKGHAGPMLWDDFDSGASGSAVAGPSGGTQPQIHQGNLSGYSQWVRGGGGAISDLSILFNSSAPKANSSRHARATFSGSSYWGLNLIVPYAQFTTGNELYFSFYYRLTRTGASFPRQTKAWIAYSASADRAYFSTAFDNCEQGGFRLHRTEGGFLDQGFPLDGKNISGEWVRFETYLKQSAPGVANGTWQQLAYRPTLGTPQKLTNKLNNVQMRTTSADWIDWTFGGSYWSMCSSSDAGTIDIDEFYMDSTPARVEVCNAPTWAGSSKCELQIPNSWSDTSITATLKRGYLGAGAAYVYVINAAGNVNASGYAVTIVP